MQFLEVCVAELVQERAVFLALLRLGLRGFREEHGAFLGGRLNLGAGPVMGECAAEVGVCVFGILEVFDEGRVAVAFHLLEVRRQLQVDVEVAPVVIPYLDLAEPFFDAQAFERGLEIQVFVDLLDRCLEFDDGIPEV